MRSWRLWSLCLVFVVVACGTARAQDEQKVGITLAYPAAIGVIWHAAPSVAVRPDFTFATTHTEGLSVTSDSWSIGTGISALFYVSSDDRVRTYVSPRFGYTRSSADSDSSAVLESTSSSWQVAGSFGAEYTPTSKFGIFGEVGVAHNRATADTGLSGAEVKNRSTGMRAGVGIIFYP